MVRIAWKIAPSLVGELPVRLLVWSRCTVHFQPVGFAVWTIAYSTPLCSIVDQTDGRGEGCLARTRFRAQDRSLRARPVTPGEAVAADRAGRDGGGRQRP
jgi:hypothetical protein